VKDNILVDAASLDTFRSLACGWHLEVIPRCVRFLHCWRGKRKMETGI